MQVQYRALPLEEELKNLGGNRTTPFLKRVVVVLFELKDLRNGVDDKKERPLCREEY